MGKAGASLSKILDEEILLTVAKVLYHDPNKAYAVLSKNVKRNFSASELVPNIINNFDCGIIV